MDQDNEHLKLLSVFHYVVGGLTAIMPCFLLMHVAIGVAMLCGAADGNGNDMAPRIMGLFFVMVPLVLMVLGWSLAGCMIAAGKCLAVRRHYMFCMVMAGFECLIVPFGTVLGVFTIVVLQRPSVKAMFESGS